MDAFNITHIQTLFCSGASIKPSQATSFESGTHHTQEHMESKCLLPTMSHAKITDPISFAKATTPTRQPNTSSPTQTPILSQNPQHAPNPNCASSIKLKQCQRAPESNGGNTSHHEKSLHDPAVPLLTYLTKGHLSIQPCSTCQQLHDDAPPPTNKWIVMDSYAAHPFTHH